MTFQFLWQNFAGNLLSFFELDFFLRNSIVVDFIYKEDKVETRFLPTEKRIVILNIYALYSEKPYFLWLNKQKQWKPNV